MNILQVVIIADVAFNIVSSVHTMECVEKSRYLPGGVLGFGYGKWGSVTDRQDHHPHQLAA